MQRYLFVGLVVLVIATAATGFGQGFQGGVRGAVLDPGGAIIPGVEVSIVNVETNATRTTTTNELSSGKAFESEPRSFRSSISHWKSARSPTRFLLSPNRR